MTKEKSRASPSLGRCVVSVRCCSCCCCCCVTSRPCGTVSLTVRPACCSCSDAFVPEFPPVSESSCEPEPCCQPHAVATRRFGTRVPNIRLQPSFIFVTGISGCSLRWALKGHPGFVYIGAVSAEAGSCCVLGLRGRTAEPVTRICF